MTDMRDEAIQRLRAIANNQTEDDLAKVIRFAFQTAGMLRDEGLAKEVETAVAILIEGATCTQAPPAVGYLRGRAKVLHEEAADAHVVEGVELGDQARILEQAAEILERS